MSTFSLMAVPIHVTEHPLHLVSDLSIHLSSYLPYSNLLILNPLPGHWQIVDKNLAWTFMVNEHLYNLFKHILLNGLYIVQYIFVILK